MMRACRVYGLWALAVAWGGAGCKGAIDETVKPYNPSVGSAAGAAAPSGTGTSGAGAAAAPVDCSQAHYAARRIWRLTPTQYDNTLHDLLGVDSTYGAGFPPDDLGVGFGNAAEALLMTPLLADKVASAAQEAAAKAKLAQIAPCAGAQQDAACLKELVTKLGTRAFRRPLSDSELQRYTALAQAPGEFDSGARLAIIAMLQSPYFLYRFELGKPSATAAAGTYELDDYEIASELSYLVWQSMPDDALFEAAKNHQLQDKTKLAEQLARLLQSERARPVVRRFVFDWLGLSTIATVPKDTTTYPELTADIRSAMTTEAERFVDGVMFGGSERTDGSLSALLRAVPAPSDGVLAQFYGPSAPSEQQGGVLTLGAVLLTHSRSNDSSPIHRGKLIRERLLCQPLPPPPPGLVLQPPGLDPTKTARVRYAEHSSNAYCNSCHELMDPIGFAFEHFDGIGRYRADDHGLAIDVSGTIVKNEVGQFAATDADGDFMGASGLIAKLDASSDAQRCYALEWFRFAYGEGTAAPSCEAQRFQELATQTGGSLVDILGAFTQADWFTMRSGPDPSTIPPVTEPVSTPSTGQAGAGSVADPQQPLKLEQTVNNDWGAGYCYTYQVTNTTAQPLTWSLALPVRGKLNNHWSCLASADSGDVTFSGADYNLVLQPNAMTEFGFCAVL